MTKGLSPRAIYSAQQPISDYSLTFSPDIYNAVTVANTPVSIVVPGGGNGRWKAVISVDFGGTAWVALNGIPIIPSSNTFVQSNCEVISFVKDQCRDVASGDTLTFISESDGVKLNVKFYTFTV